MLIAVDANVLMDEENQDADVLEALVVIRKRIFSAEFVVTETVAQELIWLSENGTSRQRRDLATGALMRLLTRGYTPLVLSPVERGIASVISLKLRMQNVIPHSEENDATIVAESNHLWGEGLRFYEGLLIRGYP